MQQRLGMIPTSVLRLGRGKFYRKIFNYQRENPERSRSTSAMQVQNEKLLRYRKSGSVGQLRVTGTKSTAASAMPPEIVAFFAKYYSSRGETYIDPFMGQGVQMQVAHALGMHYHGYDLCKEFYDFIAEVKRIIDNHTTALAITLGDSRTPNNVPDGVGDFCFTSPPYWDIEYYGDDPLQLGKQESYAGFLDSMGDVFEAWLPKFKAGAYCVVNVNDFRRQGAFYSYHADLIQLMRRRGWVLHDTWIIEGLLGSFPRAFALQRNEQRIAPKVHEYGLVFRKPG